MSDAEREKPVVSEEVRNLRQCHPFAGFLRLIAEAIAGKILEEQKGGFLVQESIGAASGPPQTPSVQGKGKEEAPADYDKPNEQAADGSH
ncbi:MAG: hypothetical protein K8I27_06450 [Planctomycetes bacterium]|nr:hypothetical protein [Planctomycetota bacterium]